MAAGWEERVGRRLRPRDLHVFLVVAEQRSMAKAAIELNVSRPVVSRAVADLEHLLGAKLFDRLPHGLEPTRYGEALLRRGFAVFDALRDMVAEIEQLRDPGAGLLRLAGSEVFTAGVIPAVLERLSERFPKLGFEVETVTAGTLAGYLRDRRGELVVTRMLADEPEPDIAAEPLYYERLLVVAGAGNPWHSAGGLSLRDLLDERWVLSPFELGPESPFVRALRELGTALPRACVLTNSVNLRIPLLQSGRYLTLMPGSILEFGAPWRGLVEVLPIRLPDWHLPTSLFRLR
ncbi:MAG TPA: LysR family transcriptional regulator, partial [Acetobacteraceae bacterium]|nr:LysR family transcriptional regulator [Acetobacteraceae bacterium]